MFSLSLVCRDINAQVSPLLWRHVAITRPSALYDLVEAIKAQPSKAKEIEGLHVGQYDTLAGYWWPLSTVDDEDGHSRWIASSLPRDQLPTGCEDRQAWRWDRRPAADRGAAVYDAIQVAQRSLGATLWEEDPEWAKKVEPVFEVQSALDLYLVEMRRLEEESSEPVLPPLVLTGAPARTGFEDAQRQQAQNEPADNAFVLPYAELLRHLARQGPLTDRFDHPLILERSTFTVKVNAPPAKSALHSYVAARVTFNIDHQSERLYDEQKGSKWSGWEPLQVASAKFASFEKNPYSLAMCTATMSAVLPLARAALYATTNLRNISLTGYLEQAMLGKAKSSVLRASIGPTALPGWDAFLPMRGLKLVEELRLCGKNLRGWETRQVAVMTRLRRFEYCLREPFVESERGKCIEHIFGDLFKVSDATLDAFSGSTGEEEEQSEAGGNDERNLPLIIARLVPEDTMRVLAKAPSEEHRTAWLEGRPMPGALRRLVLKQNEAPVEARDGEAGDGGSSIQEVMYEDGRRYWRGVLDV